MKYVKTFEQYSEVEAKNEEIFGWSAKEKAQKEADKQRLAAQFAELKGKLKDPNATVEQALEFAEKRGDDFKGNFSVVRGILQYDAADTGLVTGGSRGFGTAY